MEEVVLTVRSCAAAFYPQTLYVESEECGSPGNLFLLPGWKNLWPKHRKAKVKGNFCLPPGPTIAAGWITVTAHAQFSDNSSGVFWVSPNRQLSTTQLPAYSPSQWGRERGTLKSRKLMGWDKNKFNRRRRSGGKRKKSKVMQRQTLTRQLSSWAKDS